MQEPFNETTENQDNGKNKLN